MDPEGRKFGRGQKELTGAVDLLSHYNLLGYHEFFCQRSLPQSISETGYLRRVVGETEIRKGEGMELGQLIETSAEVRPVIRPFDLDCLREAFDFRETGHVDLPSEERGSPTISGRVKVEAKERERKSRKRKDKDWDKEKEKKKHKHKGQVKEKREKGVGQADLSRNPSKRQDDKKRKQHGGTDDLSNIYKHKKSKHKSSKVGEMGAIRVAG